MFGLFAKNERSQAKKSRIRHTFKKGDWVVKNYLTENRKSDALEAKCVAGIIEDPLRAEVRNAEGKIIFKMYDLLLEVDDVIMQAEGAIYRLATEEEIIEAKLKKMFK